MSSFIVKGSGGNYETAPAGMHLARCYQIIDLGTQRTEYKGVVKFLTQLQIGWELHAVDENNKPIRMMDGRIFAAFKPYTNSLNEKSTLRKHLQAWRGQEFTPKEIDGFDMENILGKWCMLTIIHKAGEKGTFANIDAVAPVLPIIKQAGIPEPVNPTQMFSLQQPDMKIFEGLPARLKTSIMASPEWGRLSNKPPAPAAAQSAPAAPAMDEDDDIPF